MVQSEDIPEQKELISGYINQYSSSIDGLGLILSKSHINKLYRGVSVKE